MPKFYLHEKNHPDRKDLEGADFTNAAAARQEATLRLNGSEQELNADKQLDAIEVEDEGGNLVHKVVRRKTNS